MNEFELKVAEIEKWFVSPRFAEITRLHTARQVAEQRGAIPIDYPIAHRAAEEFYARLRQLYAEKKAITTFGPYTPGQAVNMKRLGIEGIYLGGWATSAKGSVQEDPGADLASYPLSQVPDEAAPIVRALLAADRNQHFNRSRMTEKQRESSPIHDFRPFIIADADTGHGGDAHVRNLIRRFVEVGVPGYHIEDQKPGAKKCGHQGGKVVVPVDEQIKRLNTARFQLDVMAVPGIIVARTDAEAASLLDGRGDERDQPFLLGATNVNLPSYKACFLAILRALSERGVDEIRGHLLYDLSDAEYAEASSWIDHAGVTPLIESAAADFQRDRWLAIDSMLSKILDRFLDVWEGEAGLKTYGQAVADVIDFRAADGEDFELSSEEWLTFAGRASLYEAQSRAADLGIQIIWDCERAKTPEGYYQIKCGIDYAIVKSLAAAPFADIVWMETKTADLADAKEFAHAIHAEYPEQMLAYNLSPSFNWDTTGMSEDEMKRFPDELAKLGYVFNFITYGGHQVDGLASEEFATALKEDGMLALARLQRKLRLLDSPYRTPQTLVGGPRLDGALSASAGRTATTKAMGKGSTQFQHLVQTEVPTKVLAGWIAEWTKHHNIDQSFRVKLRPHTAGSDLLELSVLGPQDERIADVVFAHIRDRRERSFLSIRDQNNYNEKLRQKRLMTLLTIFLIHRYKAVSLHYVTPTEDNHFQAKKMKMRGIFSNVHEEVGQIIVAEINQDRIKELVDPDSDALATLITKGETQSV